MDEIIPWDERVGVIEPYYPKGKRGRPPMAIEKMLRMYLLQIWFSLSDPTTEDAIYDSYAMRKFTGIDFMTEAAPDETTLWRGISFSNRAEPCVFSGKDDLLPYGCIFIGEIILNKQACNAVEKRQRIHCSRLAP